MSEEAVKFHYRINYNDGSGQIKTQIMARENFPGVKDL